MPKPRIMVVEDEFVVAAGIRNILQNEGYDVPAVVSTGEEALNKAEEEKPDLVLMDIVLTGELNGINAAGLIRSRFDIPVVYLTAYSNKEILEDAKMTEPFGYLVKPLNQDELRATIEMALHKAGTERQRKKRFLELQDKMARIETLHGVFCICSSCKKIRDDDGNWNQIEEYIQDHSKAKFTHGICPECLIKLYPEF